MTWLPEYPTQPECGAINTSTGAVFGAFMPETPHQYWSWKNGFTHMVATELYFHIFDQHQILRTFFG